MIPAQMQIRRLPPRRRPARTSPSWRWVAGRVLLALREGSELQLQAISSLPAHSPPGLGDPEEPGPAGQKTAAASGPHLPHPQEGRQCPAAPVLLCGGGSSQRLDVQGLHRWGLGGGGCSQESPTPPPAGVSRGPRRESGLMGAVWPPLGPEASWWLPGVSVGEGVSFWCDDNSAPLPFMVKKRSPPGGTKRRKRSPLQQRGSSVPSPGCHSFRAWPPPPSRYIREDPSPGETLRVSPSQGQPGGH